MNGIMIYFTDSAKQSWVPHCTPEQWHERLAAGDFANLRLDRPSVRIEYGQSAGATFISEGVIPNPSSRVMEQAKRAAEEAKAARLAPARHEPKPGDTLVILGKEYVIDEDGEPVPKHPEGKADAATIPPLVAGAKGAAAVAGPAHLPAETADGDAVDRPAAGGAGDGGEAGAGVGEPRGQAVPPAAGRATGNAGGKRR